MSTWLITLCGVIHLWVAAEQAFHMQWAMGVLYFGYALSEVGAVLIISKGGVH